MHLEVVSYPLIFQKVALFRPCEIKTTSYDIDFAFRTMKRYELQALAKLHGVRANAKSSYITEQLTAKGILGTSATVVDRSAESKAREQPTRQELQALAKLHDVRANAKSSYIAERLTAKGILLTDGTVAAAAAAAGLKAR